MNEVYEDDLGEWHFSNEEDTFAEPGAGDVSSSSEITLLFLMGWSAAF